MQARWVTIVRGFLMVNRVWCPRSRQSGSWLATDTWAKKKIPTAGRRVPANHSALQTVHYYWIKFVCMDISFHRLVKNIMSWPSWNLCLKWMKFGVLIYYGSTENGTKFNGSQIYTQQHDFINFFDAESVNQISFVARPLDFFRVKMMG